MAGYGECWGKTSTYKECEEVYEGKQEWIRGQRQRESPANESLEQVRCCKDTDCSSRMMKQGLFFALKWIMR